MSNVLTPTDMRTTLAAYKAYRNDSSAKIEYCSVSGKWEFCNMPSFDSETMLYRIKAKDVNVLGCVVRHTSSNRRYIVTAQRDGYVTVGRHEISRQDFDGGYEILKESTCPEI